jgi:hypothetical protein
MTTATAKIQLGAAALVMAAAAITPVVAQADPLAPLAPSLTSIAKTLGSSAAAEVCDPTSGSDCATLVTTAAASAVGSKASAVGSIFKNNVVWIGNNTLPGPTQNSNFWNDADTVNVWTFTPLNAVLWAKPYLPGLWAWFDSRSAQTCVFGITTALGGPYSAAGTYTHSYNHKGCNPS